MKTFTKAERISSKILIDELIKNGKSFSSFPFRAVWQVVAEDKVKVKIVISVPKRLFKRAVDRNRLKRLIREGYRKNKTILLDKTESKTIEVFFIYTSKTMMESKEMEEKIVLVLQQLVKKINSKQE